MEGLEKVRVGEVRMDRFFHGPRPMSLPSIVLIQPKYAHNVGQVFRIAACFGVEQVWTSGRRIRDAVAMLDRLPREERNRGYREVTLIGCDDPLEHLPSEAEPVAVEVRAQSESLPEFVHPANAVYVFGPEDGSLDRSVLTRCHRFVRIPTRHCLNLSVAVGTVLYDRAAKASTFSEREFPAF
ncbi:MAG: TrmH family RNA methyltransferase [Capsulimonadales bacterium]|nr:TrmH family RNA methyltransferase [Capsulimonadales bacterium]